MSLAKKEVTILNADICGFSALFRHFGAEQAAEIINEFYTSLSGTAEKYGGTILEFLGDGFICLFEGENHAQSAVKAALEMKEQLIELSSEKEYPIRTTSIVTTGEAITGKFGKGNSESYNAIGVPVNMSFSLGKKVKGDRLLLDEATYELAKNEVDVKDVLLVKRSNHEGEHKCYEIYSQE